MSFSQHILDTMRAMNITKSELARAVDIPYTTLDSMLKRDSDGERLKTVFAIADQLGVSVEELVYGEERTRRTEKTLEEKKLLDGFRRLDSRGKKTVLALCEAERGWSEEPSPAVRGSRMRRIPVYDAPAAAGTALPLLSDDYRMTQGEWVPENADFGIRISGDSMEPQIHSGDIVWVQRKAELFDGAIGIFLLNGESLCKKLDHVGSSCRLVSLNRRYRPIEILDTDELKVVGQVLLA